jgi:hypothetical protein
MKIWGKEREEGGSIRLNLAGHFASPYHKLRRIALYHRRKWVGPGSRSHLSICSLWCSSWSLTRLDLHHHRAQGIYKVNFNSY